MRMKKLTRSQLDLFATPPLPIDLPLLQRSKALTLLQALLIEALSQPEPKIEEQERLNDDKDHE
jgi:hypothetical protein